MTGWRRRAAALAAGGVVIVAGVAVGGPEPAGDGRPTATLAYLSGLDDHLLEAHDSVPLYAGPGGTAVAELPTGSLVWVYAEAGEWVEVEPVEPGPGRGWVADFFLRGELHLVDPETPGCPVPAGAVAGRPDRELGPSTRVRLVDIDPAGPAGWVRVRPLRAGGDWWVERRVLSERPGPDVRRPGPGVPCEQVAPRTVSPHDHRPDGTR